MFVSVLRKPDFVTGATEDTPFRFEEDKFYGCPVQYEYIIGEKSAKVVICPGGSPVKYLKLRFNGDLSFVDKVYGDQWERSGAGAYLEWRSVQSSRVLPWFCYVRGENKTACYGVKTGADCFAFWQVDTHGVTLFLNLCCGNDGTHVKEPFVACKAVELFGAEGEDVYYTARRFSAMMCEKPVLPVTPVFGVNNWYWAYGNITKESVLREADYLAEMTSGCKNRPYMIIDDGWQANREPKASAYIGGAWEANERFEDMAATAAEIHARGAKAGLWFRPLLTRENVPHTAVLASDFGGEILDPSHPFTLEKAYKDAAKIRGWGFELIKHDFTTNDFTGNSPLTSEKHDYELFIGRKPPYDNTKTSATIVKNLYKAIQQGANGAEVIGCNTVGHLSAGIHSVQRTGGDTSGRSFEWTKRDGVNTVMRLPLNNVFFNVDPDCAAFTEMVDAQINLDYLEMCAYTGMTTLASVTPYSLNKNELKRINGIFKIADEGKYGLGIKNYEKTSEPEIFISKDGKTVKKYDWTKVYNGSRTVLKWTE